MDISKRPMPAKPLKDFTPPRIKLADLYSHASSHQELPASIKPSIQSALAKAGYEKGKIGKIITGEKLLTAQEAKKIAEHLGQHRVIGFEKKNPGILVDSYLKKEAVKKRNIAGLIQERYQESLKEDLTAPPKTGKPKTGGVKLSF